MAEGTTLDTKEAKDRKQPISVTIKDQKVLYSAYMYFLKYGGLFIPIDPKNFKMMDEVQLIVSLIDDPDKHMVDGRVIWITPQSSQGNKAAGVGFEFVGASAASLRAKIENILASSLKSDEPTHTM